MREEHDLQSDPQPAPREPSSALSAALIGALAAACVVGFGVYLATIEVPRPPEVGEGATLLPVPLEIPEFALSDHRGRPFDRSRLEGRWSLLFFGYTYCPDVCPITLQNLSPVQEALAAAPDAGAVQVVFVSVDPERDSRERLAEYVGFFHPDLLGVTGEPPEIDRLAKAVGAFYRKADDDAPADGYLVDHSAKLFLVDPGVRMRAVLDDPHEPEEFLELLGRIRSL
ncbi:MAG: SCO family protein [Myxococcota bacterium]